MTDGHDIICADRLTTFDISANGERFCMNVADESGQPRGLSLPTECLTALIMTLPEIASRALKARFQDDTLRIVYQLGGARVDAAPVEDVTILSLWTGDGFSVSFALKEDDLKRLEKAVRQARTKARPIFVKN